MAYPLALLLLAALVALACIDDARLKAERERDFFDAERCKAVDLEEKALAEVQRLRTVLDGLGCRACEALATDTTRHGPDCELLGRHYREPKR